MPCFCPNSTYGMSPWAFQQNPKGCNCTQQPRSKAKKGKKGYKPPQTPPEAKQTVYEPCVHLHFKPEHIDRECLTREQYYDMLATPKGYPWLGNADCQNPELERKSKSKKKKKQIRKDEEEDDIDECPTRGDAGDFADEFVEDMWDVMSPEITCRLIDFLVNEFGMSVEEAEDFIDCKSCVGKQTICRKKKSKTIIGLGPKYKWVKEFSDVFSKRIEQYIINMLMTRRTPRTKRIAEKILESLCDLTGEKTTLQNPKTKIQKIMVLISDRLALWIDDMMTDIDKPQKRRVSITEEDEKEETMEEDEGEEEAEEEGETAGEEERQEPQKKEPEKDEKPEDKEEEQEKDDEKVEDKEEEKAEEKEEEKTEEAPTEQVQEKEPEPEKEEPQPSKEEEKEEPVKEEETKPEKTEEPVVEDKPEEPPTEEPEEKTEAPIEQTEDKEPIAEEKEEPPAQGNEEAAEIEATQEEAPAEEETPVEGETPVEEEIPVEEEKPSEEEETAEEEKPIAEEEPVEEDKSAKVEPEEELPGEELEEEKQPEEPEVVDKEKEKRPFGDVFDLVKEDIESTPKDRRTDRQKADKEEVLRRIEKHLAGKNLDFDSENVDDTASRVAHWMEHVLGSEEPTGLVRRKKPSPAYGVNLKSGSTLEVQKLSSGTVAQNTAAARGMPVPERERTVPETTSPMNLKSTQEWIEWANSVGNVGKEWSDWIDSKLTDAEKQIAEKKTGGISDFKQWRDQAQAEAQKWRVEKEKIKGEGKLWDKKIDKKLKEQPETEVRSMDM